MSGAFCHLLVPLDGSSLAEAVLPAATVLAGRVGAAVTLLHVVEAGAPGTVHGEPHLQDAGRAAAYLERVAGGLRAVLPVVEWHVHEPGEGGVARTIVDHAVELGCDLVVLCTHGRGHGRGGLRGLVFGTIAQQVLRQGAAPVLLLRPARGGGAPPFAARKLLVPLDGAPEHEVALPVALALAESFEGAVHLVVVIPTLGTLGGEQAAVGRLVPRAMRAVLELAERGATEYLRGVTARVGRPQLALTAEVCRGAAAPEVVKAVGRAGADLIVMASHGAAGLSAFWSDAVTHKVVSRFTGPLLVVPAR